MKLCSLYHSICLYIPFSLINLMVIFIFYAYINNYLLGFLYNDSLKQSILEQQTESENQYFTFIIMPFLSKHQFVSILYCTIFFIWVIMMLINLYITLLLDPGYFGSPLTSEWRLIVGDSHSEIILNSKETKEKTKPRQANKIKFITNFDRMVSNGPLSYLEQKKMKQEMNRFLCHHTDYNQHEKDINEQIELCANCLRWKPERAHHCKRCEKCVLKMDHHCPWLSNCIGLYNYKPFLLTIFYGLLAALSVLCTYWEYLAYILTNPLVSHLFCIWNTFAYVCDIVLCVFLVYLFLSNWRLVLVNMTTIEKAEYSRFMNMSTTIMNNADGKKKTGHKYDHGVYKNFIEVFGENPLRWLLP